MSENSKKYTAPTTKFDAPEPPPPVRQDFTNLLSPRRLPVIPLVGTSDLKGKYIWVSDQHINVAMHVPRGDWSRALLIVPGLTDQIADELLYVMLHLVGSRAGDFFMWAIPYRVKSKAKLHGYYRSALSLAANYSGQWMRLHNNKVAATWEATGTGAEKLPSEPKWPEETLEDLMVKDLGNRIIDDADHPIIIKLRGS